MPKENENLLAKHGGYKNTRTWQLADLIYDITMRFCDKFVDPRSRTHDQMVQAARSGAQNLQEGSMDSGTSKKIELKLTGTAKGSLAELQRDYQKFLSSKNLPEWTPDHPALCRFKKRRCDSLEDFRLWVAEEVKRVREETGRLESKHTDLHGRGNTDLHGRGNTDLHGLTRTCEDADGAGCGAEGAGRGAEGAGCGPGGAGHGTGGVERPRKDSSFSSDVRVSPCKSLSSSKSVSSFRPLSLQELTSVVAANGALSLLNLCVYLVKRQMEAQAKAFEEEGGFTERLYRIRSEKRENK